jgi:peroxin-12
VQDRKETTSNQRRLIPMPKLDAVRLAFLVSFGPYLAERTDILYNDLGPVDGTLTSSSLSQKLQKFFKFAYPFLHMSVQGVHLLEQWKYLLGQSVFFDPYSKWLNLVVRRVTGQDQAQKNSNGHSKQSNSKMLETTLDKSRSMMTNSTLKATALGIVSSALAIGWMARVRATRQELQRRIPSQLRQAGTEGPQQHDPLPPPPAPLLAIDVDLASLPATICPLCRQPRINPTASTGGYVFCLKCIIAHVRENETCPVTGRECPESMLVRLYEPHTTS